VWLSAGTARAGGPLPDLTAAITEVTFERDTSVGDGDVAEGCASATTGVDLLRFSATTRNEGPGDLVLGDPICPDCEANPGAQCGNPDFHCSPAGGHDHAHYTDYAIYELLDGGGATVRTGGKLGFCLIDTSCDPGSSAQFNCSFQGLSAGCSDLYHWTLGCQYVEVTGLAPGAYTLRMTVDPLGQIAEADETNNEALVPVEIEGTTPDDLALPGRSLRLRARNGGGTSARITARQDDLPLPVPPEAPTLRGAELALEDLGAPGSAVVFPLPAAGWRALGSPAGSRGYRYRGEPLDPCPRARLAPSGVKAKCRAAGLALPAAAEVQVVLTVGGAKRYCATFGGTEKRNDAQRLLRVEAPAAPCPAP
jgi:hypothetical protein